MRRIVVGAAAALVSLVTVSAKADTGVHNVVPSLGIEVGSIVEDMEVPGGSDSRTLFQSNVGVGLGYQIGDQITPGGSLHGHSEMEVGLIFHRGDVPIVLRQELLWHQRFASWAVLSGGVQTGFHINTSASELSYLQIAPVLGFRIGFAELRFTPAFLLPLGEQNEAVLGGETKLSVGPAFAPMQVAMRFHLDALKF